MISYGDRGARKAGVTEMMIVTGGTHAGEFFKRASGGRTTRMAQLPKPDANETRTGARNQDLGNVGRRFELKSGAFGTGGLFIAGCRGDRRGGYDGRRGGVVVVGLGEAVRAGGISV